MIQGSINQLIGQVSGVKLFKERKDRQQKIDEGREARTALANQKIEESRVRQQLIQQNVESNKLLQGEKLKQERAKTSSARAKARISKEQLAREKAITERDNQLNSNIQQADDLANVMQLVGGKKNG